MSITIYGTPVSTYVRTVRLLLAEANIKHKIKSVNPFQGENKTDEYLAENPFGKIPTLETEGIKIYETLAITHYLDRKLADGKFAPSDILAQARMYQIIAIIDNYLYPSAVGTIVIQSLIVPSQGGKTDDEAVKKAIAPSQKALKAIEDLSMPNPFLVASNISIADFYLIPIFVYLEKTPQFSELTANAPKLKQWWDKVKSLDSVARICR